MNDVLPPEPLPIVKDPRQQRRIGRSETSPRHEFGDNPVIQLAPPLICDESHFIEIEQILRSVLTEAWARL